MRFRVLLFAMVATAVVAGAVVAATGGADPVAGEAQVVLADAGPAEVSGTWPNPPKAKPKPKPTKQPTSFTVADAIGAEVPLFSAPGVPLENGRVLENPTWEGLAVVFWVKGIQGEWLDVQVSSRPNGMRAWVRASDVTLRTVPNWIRVETGARRVTVFHGDKALFQTAAAVGSGRTPTPLGWYFVDGIVLLRNTGGPYGVAQISVSAFSEVHQTFGGGVGQIALHGTNSPGLLGQAVSNGCVRLQNDAIMKIIETTATGTPVQIVA